MPMTHAYSSASSLVDRVVRRFVADLIANVPEQLKLFETRVVEPFVSDEAAVKSTLIPGLHEVLEWQRGFPKPTTREEAKDLDRQFRDRMRPLNDLNLKIRGYFRYDPWYAAGARIAGPLFLGILQQYVLPPTIRRGIEAASRFWSKSKMIVSLKSDSKFGVEADIEYAQIYLRVCAEMKPQLEAAKAAVATNQLHKDEGSSTRVSVGSFTLVNTGGFDDKTMAHVAEVMKRAEAAMRGAGLGKVCYGDVLVSKTIRAKTTVMAFYQIKNDEFFVRANVKADQDTVRVVCHELAHRLQNMFLKGKQGEINNLFRRLALSERMRGTMDPSLYPSPGETMEEGRKKLIVVDKDLHRERVLFKDENDPSKAYSMPLKNWLAVKGVDFSGQDLDGFVTPYAASDPDENFAEMVSYYAVKKLPKNQVPLLEAIIK